MKAIIIALIFSVVLNLCVAQPPGACNPLVPEHCLMPFPSDYYTYGNASTANGIQVNLYHDTVGKDRNGASFNPSEWNTLDGFSTYMSFNTYFPDVDIEDPSIPRWWNIEKSVNLSSPTLVFEFDSRKLIPHFAELDGSSSDTAENKTFMIWPAEKLDHSRTYVVVIRNLKTKSGMPVSPSAEFKNLRDSTPSSDPDVERMRPHYNRIFHSIAELGIPRNEVLIAWDFTTISAKQVQNPLLKMRDEATKIVERNGFNYTITSYEDNYNDYIYRHIVGTFKVPLYLDSAYPGGRLVYDSNGSPVPQDWVDAPFELNIPRSVFFQPSPSPILQYGHGLFGTHKECHSTVQSSSAEKFKWIVFGTDLWGLSSYDVPAVALMIMQDLSNFGIIADRNAQGILNSLILTKVVARGLINDPLLIVNNTRLINPTKRWYNGNSQGGISGNMVMALSQDLQRGCLGVPGAPYNIMLPRSVDFSILFEIIKYRYPNPFDRINFMNLFAMLWEKSEPSGFLHAVLKNPLPNTPRKDILVQYALGDAQVSWLATLTMSRSMGLSVFRGNVKENNESFYGFNIVDDLSTSDSVMVGFRYKDVPPVPLDNTPPLKEHDTHSLPRKDPRALEQMYKFFTTGIVHNTCGYQGCEPI